MVRRHIPQRRVQTDIQRAHTLTYVCVCVFKKCPRTNGKNSNDLRLKKNFFLYNLT